MLQVGFGLEVKDTTTLNIYLSGCLPNKNCARDKCHNQDLLDFNFGSDYKNWLPRIKNKTTKLIKGFCLLGGEPLDQDFEQLMDLINFLKKANLPIYLYTGYTKSQLDNHKHKDIFSNFEKIYYGAYIPNKKDNKKELVYVH